MVLLRCEIIDMLEVIGSGLYFQDYCTNASRIWIPDVKCRLYHGR